MQHINASCNRHTSLHALTLSLPLPNTIPDTSFVTQLLSVQACFEPSLDYVVTKIPRWDLGKFEVTKSTQYNTTQSIINIP